MLRPVPCNYDKVQRPPSSLPTVQATTGQAEEKISFTASIFPNDKAREKMTAGDRCCVYLTRHKAVAWKIAVPVVPDVAVDRLVQRPEGADVGVRHRVKHINLVKQQGL